jgi:hypothetical protein
VIVSSAFEAPALVSSFDDVAVMGEAIEQCGRHLSITQDARPFTERRGFAHGGINASERRKHADMVSAAVVPEPCGERRRGLAFVQDEDGRRRLQR